MCSAPTRESPLSSSTPWAGCQVSPRRRIWRERRSSAISFWLRAVTLEPSVQEILPRDPFSVSEQLCHFLVGACHRILLARQLLVLSSSQTKGFCCSSISSGCCLPATSFSSVPAGANTCRTSPLTMWTTWTACTPRASPESETEVSSWQSLQRVWNLQTKKRRVQLCSLAIN